MNSPLSKLIERRVRCIEAWQLCSYKPVTVGPDTPVADVARLMVGRRIRQRAGDQCARHRRRSLVAGLRAHLRAGDPQRRLRLTRHCEQGAHVMNHTERPVSRRSIVAVGAAATGMALTATLVHGEAGTGRALQATIRTDARVITLVNVFVVEPGNLPSLLDVLRDGTESFFSKMPGFVSSSALTARDGRHAINYSQWRSTDHIAAFRQDPRFAPYIQRLRTLATAEGFECEVAYVNSV